MVLQQLEGGWWCWQYLCFYLTRFHLKDLCTDQAATARPALILTGFNGFARRSGRSGCMSTGDGSGLDVSMNWVRRP